MKGLAGGVTSSRERKDYCYYCHSVWNPRIGLRVTIVQFSRIVRAIIGPDNYTTNWPAIMERITLLCVQTNTRTHIHTQLAGTYNQWGTFASVVTGCLYRSHDCCSCTLAFCPIASVVCPARTSITARAEDRVIASHRVRKARKVGNGINRRHTLTSLLIDESLPVPIGWLISNQPAD